MAVLIKDLLNTRVFENCEIVAGADGLDNNLTRISFSDCEIRENELTAVINNDTRSGMTKPGDFYVSSLFLVKDDFNKLFDFFKYLVICNSSGICIINEYLSTLPKKVLDYANENNFPIIFIDTDVPYAEIIQTTMELVLLDQSNIIAEMKIDRLIEPNISKEEIIRSAKHINGAFSKYYLCIFFSLCDISPEHISMLKINLSKYHDFSVVEYRSGFLIIMNYDKLKLSEQHINYIIQILTEYTSSFKLGISNTFSDITSFNICVRQALSSHEISDVIGNNIVYYKDLNVYKILYPFKNSRQLSDYHNEVYTPLAEYDNYYNSDLLITLEAYLENDGDYKKTAEALHQHTNTIRYRILKAKKILDLENNHTSFIEQISIAFKIHKILFPQNK